MNMIFNKLLNLFTVYIFILLIYLTNIIANNNDMYDHYLSLIQAFVLLTIYKTSYLLSLFLPFSLAINVA